ncbi:MAG: hypothetical protein LUG44_06675 [Clostridiales bacterium]|nr:hypothetical protein [Clostridiales bacterium]
MKRNSKRFLSLALAMMLALSLTACGGSSETTAESSLDPGADGSEVLEEESSTTAETVADDGDSSTEITDEMESLYDATLRITPAE